MGGKEKFGEGRIGAKISGFVGVGNEEFRRGSEVGDPQCSLKQEKKSEWYAEEQNESQQPGR